MTAKILGALMVFGSATLFGRRLSRPVRQRIVALSEWDRCLTRLGAEMGWRQRPLLSALKVSAREMEALESVVAKLGEELAGEELPLDRAVDRALADDHRLGREERDLLAKLIVFLSTAPVHQHTGPIAAAQRELGQIGEGLKTEGMKEVRLVETLSTLTGVAMAVLLL